MTEQEQKLFNEMKKALQQAREALGSCGEDENDDGDFFQYFDDDKVQAALSSIIRILT